MNTFSFNTEFLTRTARQAAPVPTGNNFLPLPELVRAVVQNIADGRIWQLTQRAVDTLPPKAMLAVLTYCYAQHIYGTSEIQRRVLGEVPSLQTANGEMPDANAIRRFREQNRSLLNACLAAVLLALAGQKVAAGIVTKINETFAVAEARRRLTMAAYQDAVRDEAGFAA